MSQTSSLADLLNKLETLAAFEYPSIDKLLRNHGYTWEAEAYERAIQAYKEYRESGEHSSKRLVLVDVSGGLVQATKEPGSVITKVIDWDNLNDGNTCPNCHYEPNEEDPEKAPVCLSDLDNCPDCGFPFKSSLEDIYNWLIYNGILDKQEEQN